MKNAVMKCVCCALIFLLNGCGLTSHQIVKTHSFANATADIGALSEEEFIYIRRGIIEMNQELVAIDNTKTSDGLVFDKPTYVEPTSKRVAASKALKLYGELLSKLVSENRSEDLQKAASLLLYNTSSALEKDLTDDKKNALNNLIAGVGSFWLANKKAKAAKEIVFAYQEPVDQLANLLIQDFSLDDNAKGYLKAYEVTAKRLKNASMKLVDAGEKYSVLERDRAVHAMIVAQSALSHANELNGKSKNAIETLKKANNELVKVLNNEKYNSDDIKDYAKQIQELVNVYQVLSK